MGAFVGRYHVDVQSFEQVALPTLNRLSCVRSSSKVEARRELVVIAEIGKMELFSHQFVDAVRELFQSDKVVIMATVPVTKGRALPLVDELKQRKDCALFEVGCYWPSSPDCLCVHFLIPCKQYNVPQKLV